MDASLSLLLLKKIVVLFIMVFMGFLTVKRGRLKSTDSSVLSRLCFDWIIPCSLLSAFQTEFNAEKAQSFLFACIAAFASIVLFILLTRLCQKPLKWNVAEQGTAAFSNSAGIGAPLAAAVLGDNIMFYASAHMGLQNIFILTYLPIIMSREAKISWKKLIFNRNILSIVLGLTFFLTGFKFPDMIGSAVKTVGGLLSPVSMFMVGMLIGGVDFKKVLVRWKLYAVTAARLLIFPIVYILLVKVTGVAHMFPYANEVLLVILICSSAPAAALVTQLADVYRAPEEAQDAGTLNVLTTLFCIITMPLLVFIYQLICG